ncbi:MucR family transcriptional regulator [Acidiphilium sp.]|uniref:MucR family transcriptional regulator n=1 Tax=Acidiphilium sp. TaxID=527 RepID=UPI003D02B21D
MSDAPTNSHLLDLTAQIIAAHVSHNSVTTDMLPALIRDVYQSLSGTETPVVEVAPPPEPAVNPKKSVFNDYIICLEDGKKLKMLRRHLKSAYNLTPEQYRERWQLPAEYPMVAPSYAKQRSNLAKKIGLGTKPAIAAPAAPAPAAPAPTSRKKKDAAA